ncbi:hypothetical protein I302_106530 [Kwoniella bestiolae CBS 10118]|uniref:HIT-type domain-containing protein n=1 Tax=Kwoniella bestiolae CBS 10118 TaxID=1296100 RepID=A0A1B9G158_9TREE|nr:hypothetical protein I302_06211 [Kwoniella bestiolae CBS 10118]OCF24750.1 hypothetical protein I302_06211 [Kwoniella bestiolae CBS 10118]
MGPKRTNDTSQCQICKDQISKYKCPACPIRYCSVKCYKEHKLIHEDPSKSQIIPQDTSAPTREVSLNEQPNTTDIESAQPNDDDTPHLKPLTSLLWPPEPDSSIFTDPLQREDPKPLRREELLRIATSPTLRNLLSNPLLPRLLHTLDSLPSKSRHTALSKLLGLDPTSLSSAEGITQSFLAGRDSPPPLDELLSTIANQGDSEDKVGLVEGKAGWYIQSKGGERIWIGDEEKRVMRAFAGVVCNAIDGGDNAAGEVEWGQGGLEWEF